jgi:hypothetical protein
MPIFPSNVGINFFHLFLVIPAGYQGKPSQKLEESRSLCCQRPQPWTSLKLGHAQLGLKRALTIIKPKAMAVTLLETCPWMQ